MNPSSTPLRILLVEDQPMDAELIVEALVRSGVIFSPIERVTERAQFISDLARSPDLVLCDYSLPGFGAMEALSLVKERNLIVPFIIISGSIGEETAVEAIKAGADDYLLKDRLGRLGPAIFHAIEEKQLRAATARAEEDLRQSEYKYRCLFDHLPDAAFLCDSTSGRIIDTNQQGLALIGLERATILGVRLSRFISDDAWSALNAFAAAKAGDVCTLEARFSATGAAEVATQIRATIVEIYQRRLLFVFVRLAETGAYKKPAGNQHSDRNHPGVRDAQQEERRSEIRDHENNIQ